MGNFNLVKYHVQSSIRAAIAESSGEKDVAERLRAQGNLRLVIMSDEELRELADMLAYLPARPADAVYEELKQVVKEQTRTAYKWIGELTPKPFPSISLN